jgi:twinkle protein
VSELPELKRELENRIEAVMQHLLPAGKRSGHEWRAGSIMGDQGQSLGVHLAGEKTGVWSDFSTGESGDVIDLWKAARGLDLVTALDEIRAWLGVERPKLFQPARREWKRPVKPKVVKPVRRALDYLTEDRNLPREVIELYGIGEDDQQRIVFPFLLPDGTLAMAKRRDAVDGAKPVPTEAGCEPVLFGWQAVDPNDRCVVITEGEIDAMSMKAYGHPSLSVPYGGGGGQKQAWIEGEFHRMERFEKIYLALDMDGPGEEAATEIANRLGRHRCLRVKLPRKDTNQCLVDGVRKPEIDTAIAAATWFEVAGLRSPIEYLDDVIKLFWPTEGDHVGYRTPYGKLDTKLLFRAGEVTIWTGDSGAGKTQILSDCTVDWIKQRARICLSSLEMHPKQTLRRLCMQIVGTDQPTPNALKAAMTWATGWLYLYELTGKQKLDEMLRVFEYARARYGCDTFVIDSLMRLGIAGDDYNGQEQVVFRIVDWAMAMNVHVHLVAHSKKGERDRGAPAIEDIKGAMEIGANAFNVVSVWRNRKHEDLIAKAEGAGDQVTLAEERKKAGVLLNVAKQRNGDFEGKIGLWFDQRTYRYRSAADGEAWKRSYLPEGWQNNSKEITP